MAGDGRTGTRDGGAPVRDGELVLNGLRFHYRDWGDPGAPAVLLLHGFLCHAHMWNTLAAALADRFRVLALDLRGFGESDRSSDYRHARVVQDCAEFVEALGLARVALGGFSLGGHAALSYAAAHPDRVERLVLFECVAEVPQTSPAQEALQREALHRWRSVPLLVDSPEDAELLLREQLPRAVPAELRSFVRGGLVQQADGRWAWRWDPALQVPAAQPRHVMLPAAMWQALPQVTCPTLFVRGVESEFPNTLENCERVTAALRHGQLAQIPAAGHFAWLDNPTAFTATIRAFLLNDTDPAPSG